ncbi:MAG: hypothetical protein BroJett024_26110 [Alphaproteobacteria bacterium]|nr:MAG: hypothetical protein BroJett024_26110 [Alphaproteobacteria bacterium]
MPALPVLVAALLLLGAAPAHASCSDPAGPGVDWRRCLLDRRDFQRADLTGAVLRDASLQRTDLSGAKLVEIEGTDARFVSAKLTGADLSRSNFRSADFSRADLQGATLKETDLRRSRFFNANLQGADLTGANLADVDFTGAQLTGATWIDGARVCGEGSIGVCR